MIELDDIQSMMCDMQGRVFEWSLRYSYDSIDFITNYMNSKVAQGIDSIYHRLQTSCEGYIIEELEDEIPTLLHSNNQIPQDILYWIGYVYRYWHFMTNQSSKDIFQQADAKTMIDCYAGFHTIDTELAVENLIELHQQKLAHNN